MLFNYAATTTYISAQMMSTNGLWIEGRICQSISFHFIGYNPVLKNGGMIVVNEQ
jgi:hypothetical protein